MIDLIKTFANDTQGGAMLILAVGVIGCLQYFITQAQTKKLGNNHLEHLKKDLIDSSKAHCDSIKDRIISHEQIEFEHDRQMFEVLKEIRDELKRRK